jgi:hypothetical protein
MSESMIDLMIMQVIRFNLTVKALHYSETFN